MLEKYGTLKDEMLSQDGLVGYATFEDPEAVEGTWSLMKREEILLLKDDDTVVYQEGGKVGLLAIDAVHEEQSRVSGRRLESAQSRGAWHWRDWRVENKDGAPVRGQDNVSDLLCAIELQDGRLTPGSVEQMRKAGIMV